jgi:sterol desaturase/sphingolipid hydroxylase (fatty acid hydroxylase superfamily)
MMSEKTEIAVRLGSFAGVLLLVALMEQRAPRRFLSVRKSPRWASNLALVAVNALLVRLLMPVSAVGAAIFANSRGWGLLHLCNWPVWLETVVAVLLFDLAIYLQHVMFHAIPLFWRFHMVHHADLDLDVTTGLRFHTIEILASALFKLALVGLIGPSALSVMLFEVLLNATSMFNHGNVRLPDRLDRWLRRVIVTPDMHRVHHSVDVPEQNSNFGFNLPWWDLLLGTYREQPGSGHARMTLGVRDLRDERQVDRLMGMLRLPFVGPAGGAAVGERVGQGPNGPTL